MLKCAVVQMGPSGSGKSTLLGGPTENMCRLRPPRHKLSEHRRVFVAPCNEALPRKGNDAHADVLAGRKTAGELTGQVLMGGKPPSRAFMRRYTGYVEQFGETANTTLKTSFNCLSAYSIP